MKITLKAARANKDLTLAEAAKLIGIDTKTLWNYEKSNTYPEVPVIKKIEEVYGIDFKDIMWDRTLILDTMQEVLEGEE